MFDKFTNRYSLSKTLRFELKPVGNTQQMLEDAKVFETDEKIAESYKEAKKWFNKLHREFIDESLGKTTIQQNLYEDFEKKYFTWKKDKTEKNRKNLFGDKGKSGIAKSLRTAILDQFKKTAEEWRDNYMKKIEDKKKKEKLKKLEGLDLFFKVEVFSFLKDKYPESKDVNGNSIFNPFNKFSGYFEKFHKTRENFYKDNGTSTAIPTRIINDNLVKFLENKKLFEDKYTNKHNSIFTDEEKKIFEIEYFNQCFTQDQIDDYNDVIADLKSKINKFRQDNPDVNKKDLPYFKELFKQILGQSRKHKTEQNDFIEILEDKEVFPTLKKFIEENQKYIPQAKILFDKFVHSQKQESDEFEIREIYVANRFLNTISNKWFAGWSTLQNILKKELKIQKNKKKLPDFISLQNFKNALQKAKGEIGAEELFKDDYENIYKAEDDFYQIFIRIWEKEFNKNMENYETEVENIKNMINEDCEYKSDKKGKLKNGEIGKLHNEKILDYANSAISIYWMMKYFSLEKGKERKWNPDGLNEDQQGDFYGEFKKYYENVNTWKYFSEFRNYLTKKPYSNKKVKLNFENSTLADGWGKNRETDNFAVIFRKAEKYYLGLMKKGSNNLFIDKNKESFEGIGYEKMVYKLLPGANKMLPKVFFSKSKIDFFSPSEGIMEIRNHSSHSKSGNPQKGYEKMEFNIQDCRTLIDFFKSSLAKHKEWCNFNFNFSKTSTYKDISEFYREVEQGGYKISWQNISDKYIDDKNKKGELYLFQIYNKDFELNESIVPKNYIFKGGKTENLHTIYWKALFNETNLKETIFKLNGKAEIFFRKKSINKKEGIITNENKKSIDENDHKGGNAYKFNRFTKDKILFHCPITLNFAESEKDINTKLRKDILVNNKDINIIGIDRGEKHLAYYSVTNQKGEILEIGSFNKIKEREDRPPTDYHKKLDMLEKDRDWQRKSWQEIANIKEMKKGYISQVVKRICDLIIEHNAIVVFEDLNIGFKRERFAIEKQIYQNLELALAKKLNYLVFKNVPEGKPGHHLQAYQLTPPIQNFQDINKQCGIMFYIPASYTSAICPVCGFRKNIPTPVENLEKNNKLIKKFKISYEKENDRFGFSYHKNDFYEDTKNKNNKNKIELFEDIDLKNDFIFFSNVERLKYQRSKNNRKGEVKHRNPNDELKSLFKNNNIAFEENFDISKQIENRNDLDIKNFYKPLIYIIALIMQLRNSKTVKNDEGVTDEKESRDFIMCPSCYFHSENNLLGLEKRYIGDGNLEFNGDANGAYNIARKGALVLQKINKMEDLENTNYDLTVTQLEWDKYAQKSE